MSLALNRSIRAALAASALAALTGCGALTAGGDASAGPPEWFLRADEKARLAQLQAAAAPAAPLRFTVATDQSPEAFAARLADVAEACWIAGEPGWRLDRAERRLAMVSLPADPAGPETTALAVSVSKGVGLGLTAEAHGPLAGRAQRARLRRGLEKAKGDQPIDCALGGAI